MFLEVRCTGKCGGDVVVVLLVLGPVRSSSEALVKIRRKFCFFAVVVVGLYAFVFNNSVLALKLSSS